MKITLTPEDAVAIARVIEVGATEYLMEGRQCDVALAVAHRLLTTDGYVVIETNVPEDVAGLVTEHADA